MNLKLVKTQSSDGLRLDGVLLRPAGGSPDGCPDAAILLHGVGGNFYSSPLFDAFVDPLLAVGIAVLRVNTRGHDGLFTANTSNGARRFGAAYEIVDECRLDLAAWREFLIREGFLRIAVVGHSLGAVKAIYAAAHAAEGAFDCVAALSPPRLSYRLFHDAPSAAAFREAITRAEAFVAEGRPEELLHSRFPFPLIISAGSYVDKYGREERYDILRYVPKISCPALFLYGEKELATGGLPFAGIDGAVAGAAQADQPLEVRVVGGADHFYNGVQSAAAEVVAAWLAREIS